MPSASRTCSGPPPPRPRPFRFFGYFLGYLSAAFGRESRVRNNASARALRVTFSSLLPRKRVHREYKSAGKSKDSPSVSHRGRRSGINSDHEDGSAPRGMYSPPRCRVSPPSMHTDDSRAGSPSHDKKDRRVEHRLSTHTYTLIRTRRPRATCVHVSSRLFVFYIFFCE